MAINRGSVRRRTVIKEPWLVCRWSRDPADGDPIWSFRFGCHRSHRLQRTVASGLRRLADTPSVPVDALPRSHRSGDVQARREIAFAA